MRGPLDQKLLHIFERELDALVFTINTKKTSCCLRIGPRNDVVWINSFNVTVARMPTFTKAVKLQSSDSPSSTCLRSILSI